MTPIAADQGSLLTRTLRAQPPREQLFIFGEWVLVLGLAATWAGTTLGLGGYLAETMQVTAWAVFGLAMLAGALWLIRPDSQPVTLNWAAQIFKQSLVLEPNQVSPERGIENNPSSIFIQRCRRLKFMRQHSTDSKWDGVFELKDK